MNVKMKWKSKNNKILKDLGSGSCGIIHLVEHEDGDIVAIKTISKTQVNYKDEIKILEKLDHPNVINFYGYYKSLFKIHQVMEYIDGKDLFEMLGKIPFDEELAIEYLIEIKKGLDYIHSHNIIHRDIKTENIMVRGVDRYNVNIVIIDFGYAVEINDSLEYELCGTMDYMAPEMLLSLPYNCTLDLWSLGVLGYELFVLYPPFYSSTNEKTKTKIIARNFSFPTNFPYSYGKIINKLLSLKPQNRVFEII